jgi:DNA-binding IclR family transcriptional regulator
MTLPLSEILAYIRAHPGAGYREIAQALSLVEYDVIAACITLKKSGLITGDATGYKVSQTKEK